MRYARKTLGWGLALVVVLVTPAEGDLVITREGAYEEEVNTAGWKPGEHFLYLAGSPDFGYNYPWQGETEIDYKAAANTLQVNGKVVGVDLTTPDSIVVDDPEHIITGIVPGYDLARAAEYDNLRSLFFLGPIEDSVEFSRLVTGLKELSGLYFTAGELSEGMIRDLAACKGLVTLDFEVAVLPEGSVGMIAKLPNLRELTLASTPDDELFALRGHKNLRALTRYWEVADTGWVSFLPTLSGLQELAIIQAEIADEVLDYLARTNTLKSLSLPYSGVYEDDLPRIARMTNLETLDLSGTGVTDDELKFIGDLKNLSSLSIGGGGESVLSGSGLKHLAGLVNLGRLDLSSTGLTDEDVEILKTLPSLKSLVLVSTAITDKGLLELKDMKDLRYLDVSGTAVTDEAISSFKKTLPACNVVKYY